MPALEPFYHFFGLCSESLTKEECILLETELYLLICKELKIFFKEKYQKYFQLMKLKIKKENEMFDLNLGRFIIEDILLTQEYNLQGIACYTDMHEDVIQEVIFGINTNPSGIFLRKLIELHRHVRSNLYLEIRKKIIKGYIDCTII